MATYNTYPKQFRSSKIPIQKNSCFMLMPFSKEFDMVYGQIKQHVVDNGFTCSRADEIFGSVPIMSNILKEILKAHFIIADLTGQNANVFYELGIAHSFKDAHNIILIAQSIDDVPFDIRHLSTILYSRDNIKLLTSSVIASINEHRHHYDFYEALLKKGVVNLIFDNKSDFLDSIHDRLGDSAQKVADILDNGVQEYKENELKTITDSMLSAMYAISTGTERDYLEDTAQVLGFLLIECASASCSTDIANHLLYEIKLENYKIRTSRIISLQSDLAIMFASSGVFFDESITWIIEYFSKSKSATVDLNRYKLEKFLLTSTSSSVDEVIVNSILHENNYIREHMADISGEKRIQEATSVLEVQLKRERNIYSTSSIITALGKLGNQSSYQKILDWHELNKEMILKTEHYFILKHIYIALMKIDPRNTKTIEFSEVYAAYVGESALW